MVEWLNDYINKRSLSSKHSDDPEIGCILLDKCVFLPDNMQKTAEEHGLNFPRQIVKFKTFDQQPLSLSEDPQDTEDLNDKTDDSIPYSDEDGRKRTLASIVRRMGQPAFRNALISAYDGKCAMTGCNVLDALEAAHITPYMGEQTNTIQNGLLLRADIHTLFDLGKIAISSNDFRIILQRELRESHYANLHGKMLTVPKNTSSWPSRSALDKHKKDSGL